MDTKTYEQFFDALEKIIDEEKPYTDKVAALKEYMGEREDMNMEELISWFAN